MKFQTPTFIHRLFPELLWNVPVTDPVIYLTFDDGPHPDITPKVLNILAQFEAKACFFCVGDNVRKYPKVFHAVQKAGHLTGNHTFHHINGWRTPDEIYFRDVADCQKLVHARYFRPPYGKIRPSQMKVLKKHYQLVMWSVVTFDYAADVSEKECLETAISKTNRGSIVVFHDSLKAEKNMLYALPRFLEHFSKKGYRFETFLP
ncbi:polysaccharide deacetylase family protein [Candidatus Sulfidibacterium hydrothermale]|uniref:polysaccharide deacetylase family protein n=1 Tax=Candidatus Sulfidibacterium hydrothermale TaxID=2875962 RepID=UPI001F0ACEB1|nr:polysaccharide deacetylase family protein [Candidatus Sulfidibacterium hydrothermale]UBM63502.1 polysaccharide deacetylase family protein [Candidatus Sulfidibacterium hydrothermale]